MSIHDGSQRKRPPPIEIPSLPGARSATVPNSTQMNYSTPHRRKQQDQRQQQQYDMKTTSASRSNGSRRHGSSPLKSPLDRKTSHLFTPQFQTSQNEATISDPMDKAHVSTHISDYGSTAKRQLPTSRNPDENNRSATAMSDRVEVRDEQTGRAKIEARNEQKWFKTTGQPPPTPCTGSYNLPPKPDYHNILT